MDGNSVCLSYAPPPKSKARTLCRDGSTRCSNDRMTVEVCDNGAWKHYKACVGRCYTSKAGNSYCARPGRTLSSEPTSAQAEGCSGDEKHCGTNLAKTWVILGCNNGKWTELQACQASQKCSQKYGQDPQCEAKQVATLPESDSTSLDERAPEQLMACNGGKRHCGSVWNAVECKDGVWKNYLFCQKNYRCAQTPGQDPYC